MKMEKIKTKGTLSEKAYDVLKKSILSLELKPGSTLYEDSLSEMLGISRTPIRSALQRLAHEDLVVLASKGAYVSKLSTADFFDIYAIRESLELLSIKEAAIHRTDDELEILNHLLKLQDELILSDESASRKFLAIDRDLHMQIASCSKNALLSKYLIQINESFNRYLYYTDFKYRATNVVNEHRELVRCIQDRNSYEGEILMKNHLLGVKESILKALINDADLLDNN